MTNPPMKATTVKRPSGVWIAFAVKPDDGPRAAYAHRFIGVFDTFDLAETACAGLPGFLFANIQIGETYRDRLVNWRLTVKARA